ncbi:MAG: 3-deoxy-D-manno-octulosonic acid transferase [Flavobacteriales bacterium]|nr:3-deoxy-D-manno-octulosonic acid transferase [Flavobacteriales bacterium]
MKFLYQIGIFLYGFLMKILAIWHPKAKLWTTGRKELYQKDEIFFKNLQGGILFHCSSLGEFEQGLPVLEALKENYPDKKIILSFFSPSGYEKCKNHPLADWVTYLPLDSRSQTNWFVNSLAPEMAFFVKYEFWPNLFQSLYKKQVPIYLVSAIFRENQLFFKSYGAWYRKILKYVSYFFVQNQQSLELLKQIGISEAKIVGDTRLDRVLKIAKTPFSNTILDDFTQNRKANILIAGSTWEEDEKELQVFLKTNPKWKIVLAPHEIHIGHLDKIRQIFSEHQPLFYSHHPTKEQLATAQVLIIDTIGMLKYLYRWGNIAYIGGGFGNGIHNTLEAIVYETPVIFGPRFEKFQEAKDLIENNIGKTINKNELNKAVSYFENKNFEEISHDIQEYIIKNKGASQKIILYLRNN